MFTPPGSPLPSPRAKLDQPNPLEEMQRQAANALLTPPLPSPGSSTSLTTPLPYSPSDSSSSVNSYKPLPLPPHTRPSHTTSSSSFGYSPSPSSTPCDSPLPSPPLSPSSESRFSSEKYLTQQERIPLARKRDLEDQLHQHQSRSETKRRIGRNLKWTAIMIPILLVLATLSSHYRSSLSRMVGCMSREKNSSLELGDLENDGQPRVDIFGNPADGIHSLESMFLPHHHHGHHVEVPVDDRATLLRRASSGGISVSVASATGTPTGTQLMTGTAASTSSSTVTPTTVQDLPSIPSSSPALPTPFLQPWDSNIAQNFSSQNCFSFFFAMINDNNFRRCRPFGLLQMTSNQFSNLQSNLTALNAVVWGTCNPPLGVDQCASIMTSYASSLRSACSKDLSDRNLNAVNTLSALQAYSLTYNAGCLPDPTTDSYCYVKAAHSTNPSDLYFYSLPSGTSISNTTTLTCSSCTKSLMSLYVNSLNANASLYPQLAQVYGSAQALASSTCGPTYAQVSTNSQPDTSGGTVSLRLGLTWRRVLSLASPSSMVLCILGALGGLALLI
ncbi:hypothetical protein D9757_004456 [Collybiopsis confluens]|uniref:DUF7729 domain-containing protein n=1 Tax=Collybiopsis confluens TaxID=2823264 RepID=A0A8H5MEK7_9AGAR|nr:hypothetical protein D9757_004456 [Collybiopsis confluens]